MASVSAAHVLEDFIECMQHFLSWLAIEALPQDLRDIVTRIQALTQQSSETRHTLFRKRNLLLRPDSDQRPLDADMRQALLRKIEKEAAKLDSLLEAKVRAEEELLRVAEGQLKRFDEELSKQSEFHLQPSFPAQDYDADEGTAIDELLSNPGVDDMADSDALLK